jgi:hypothetical protein
MDHIPDVDNHYESSMGHNVAVVYLHFVGTLLEFVRRCHTWKWIRGWSLNFTLILILDLLKLHRLVKFQ